MQLNLSLLIGVLYLTGSHNLKAQLDINYYLPEINYNSDIPTPEDVLSYQIGEWHISHGQMHMYLETLCKESKRCIYTEYARSHEGKALFYLTISSENNIENIDALQKEHYQLTEASQSDEIDIAKVPIVMYQGYTIHGNESSGVNAAVLVSYYLMAGQSGNLDKLLDESVILIDPCLNPDGMQRFSTWANAHKHKTLSTDPKGREFNEVWPGGRTNHYWFDLNRDWIFNIHPSSKGRINTFHKWKPDILTDHHEMGSNSTFFFQPGIPSRTNPNTPQINQDLTESIGHYHASFLDSIGSSYYTKESYDDYYYGKGSTYPDINGSIGILFEQASSRGHLRETSNGLLSFPFTIRNQVVTSLSTQQAGLELKKDILSFKRDFYKDILNSDSAKGYYIFEESDPFKASFFLELLKRHEINSYHASENVTLNNETFDKENSYIVPKNQKQAGLIKTLFETVHEFNDSLFYDVSSWTLPLAFDVKYGESMQNTELGALWEDIEKVPPVQIEANQYAIGIEWSNYMAATVVYKLLDEGVDIKVVTQTTQLKSNGIYKEIKPGTLIIPLGKQYLDKKHITELTTRLAHQFNIEIFGIDTGISSDGNSLGSPKQRDLVKPSVAMIVGYGVNAYEAGSTWYQFDHRLEIPITMIDKNQLFRTDLSRYNTLILPDGRYDDEDPSTAKIINWVNNGGRLIAMRGAINYTRKIGLSADLSVSSGKSNKRGWSYSGISNASGAQVIGGAIFETSINRDHPLFYGYKNDKLAVFKRGTQFYKVENPLASPMIYTENPVLSGYASKENVERAKGSGAVYCFGYGSGKIIALVDNPNFRGYWLGGSKLFANTLFFPDLISSQSLLR